MKVVGQGHRASGALRLLVPLVALSFAVALLPAASSGAGTVNVITVSGALKGTLKVVPNINCSSPSSAGGTLAWVKVTLSPRKAAAWSISYRVPKPGTYKRFGMGVGTSFVLETSNFTAWVAAKGTLTVTGKTGAAGSANVTLSEHEGSATGTVYVKGSWNCA